MMKIALGAFEETWGTLTLIDGHITYEGDEPHLLALVERMRSPGMDDAALLASLPQRLRSPYAWAVEIGGGDDDAKAP